MVEEIYEQTSMSYDIPEITDYDYEEVAKYEKGGNIKNIVSILREHLEIFNQGLSYETRNACGHYSKQQAINAMNILEDFERGKSYQIDPKHFWIERQEERMPQAIRDGTSIQQNLKTFLDEGLISGYARCNSMEATMQALDSGKMISTGSRNGNRPEIKKTGVYSTKNSGTIQGHLFFIVGYDKDKEIFYAVNSYGPNRGPKNGRFDIPFSEYDNLYSKNALFDVNSEEAIRQYKEATTYEREFLRAIQTGITNGKEPENEAKRREVAVMSRRVYSKILNEVESMIKEKNDEMLEKIIKLIQK